MGSTLGKGAFSEVKVCTHKASQEKHAAKIITKKNLTEPEALLREVEILSKIKHPNILQLKAVYESENFVYIVTDLLSGGELFDRIVERGSFSEKLAAKALNDVLSALAYLHESGIVHRDLKPENLMYASAADDAALKLVDFGMSRRMNGQDYLSTVCGTPAYVAPEVFDGRPYDSAADLWGTGIITYIMLCGFEPFSEEDDEKMFERILACDLQFISPYWDDISQNAKDLIAHLICLDPAARLSARAALSHPWVTGAAASSTNLPDTSFSRLREFRAQRKLKGGAKAVLAVHRFIKIAKALP